MYKIIHNAWFWNFQSHSVNISILRFWLCIITGDSASKLHAHHYFCMILGFHRKKNQNQNLTPTMTSLRRKHQHTRNRDQLPPESLCLITTTNSQMPVRNRRSRVKSVCKQYRYNSLPNPIACPVWKFFLILMLLYACKHLGRATCQVTAIEYQL